MTPQPPAPAHAVLSTSDAAPSATASAASLWIWRSPRSSSGSCSGRGSACRRRPRRHCRQRCSRRQQSSPRATEPTSWLSRAAISEPPYLHRRRHHYRALARPTSRSSRPTSSAMRCRTGPWCAACRSRIAASISRWRDGGHGLCRGSHRRAVVAPRHARRPAPGDRWHGGAQDGSAVAQPGSLGAVGRGGSGQRRRAASKSATRSSAPTVNRCRCSRTTSGCSGGHATTRTRRSSCPIIRRSHRSSTGPASCCSERTGSSGRTATRASAPTRDRVDEVAGALFDALQEQRVQLLEPSRQLRGLRAEDPHPGRGRARTMLHVPRFVGVVRVAASQRPDWTRCCSSSPATPSRDIRRRPSNRPVDTGLDRGAVVEGGRHRSPTASSSWSRPV